MNLSLFNRDVLAQFPALLNELDQLVARANLVFGAEHNPQTGAHAFVTIEDALTFHGETQTTVGAAGGASALPATPTGYMVVTIGTAERVIPYYAKS